MGHNKRKTGDLPSDIKTQIGSQPGSHEYIDISVLKSWLYVNQPKHTKSIASKTKGMT